MKVGVIATPRPLHPWEEDLVSITQEAGQARGPVWTSTEDLAPYWDSIPVQPVAIHYTDYATPALKRRQVDRYLVQTTVINRMSKKATHISPLKKKIQCPHIPL